MLTKPRISLNNYISGHTGTNQSEDTLQEHQMFVPIVTVKLDEQ